MFTCEVMDDRTIVRAVSGNTLPGARLTLTVDALPDDFAPWRFRVAPDGSVVPIAPAGAFELSPAQFRNRLPFTLQGACMTAHRDFAAGGNEAQTVQLAVLWDNAIDPRIRTVNVQSPKIIEVFDGLLGMELISQQEHDDILAPYPAPGET